ncbi:MULTISPECIES: hypothetical protein [unclassified Tatumella]|uniref:hypothetical protein n=1 Tax=unclassified Tatumella TaxID=2649542 RepID=UPI001BB01BFD|nr:MULTISPECIES: hypothetical protein [unclassified Tatumella]MBS0854973.1 hypothetical protein [Tatumella sp. JGM16]MBS0912066.1 hypothetical protein [Tatumella sp. JGM91]
MNKKYKIIQGSNCYGYIENDIYFSHRGQTYEIKDNKFESDTAVFHINYQTMIMTRESDGTEYTLKEDKS